MTALDFDPTILCAAAHLPAGARIDWDAAERHILSGGDSGVLCADLEVLRAALSDRGAYYNLHRFDLPAGVTYIAAKVEPEPEEFDCGAYYAIVRLHQSGVLAAAGFQAAVAA